MALYAIKFTASLTAHAHPTIVPDPAFKFYTCIISHKIVGILGYIREKNMAYTDGQELEEKLSAWGRRLSDSEHIEEHAQHSPGPHDKLNEKLAQWGTSLDDEAGDHAHVPPVNRHDAHAEVSPQGKRRSHHHKKEKDEEHAPHSPRSHNKLNEKLAQWGASLDDQELEPTRHEETHGKRRSHHTGKEKNEAHAHHSPTGIDQQYLDEKLSAWGRHIDDQSEEKHREHTDHSSTGHDGLFHKLGHVKSTDVEIETTRKGLQDKL